MPEITSFRRETLSAEARDVVTASALIGALHGHDSDRRPESQALRRVVAYHEAGNMDTAGRRVQQSLTESNALICERGFLTRARYMTTPECASCP